MKCERLCGGRWKGMKTGESKTMHTHSMLFSSHIRGLGDYPRTHNSLCLCSAVDSNAPAVLAEACSPVLSLVVPVRLYTKAFQEYLCRLP